MIEELSAPRYRLGAPRDPAAIAEERLARTHPYPSVHGCTRSRWKTLADLRAATSTRRGGCYTYMVGPPARIRAVGDFVGRAVETVEELSAVEKPGALRGASGALFGAPALADRAEARQC